MTRHDVGKGPHAFDKRIAFLRFCSLTKRLIFLSARTRGFSLRPYPPYPQIFCWGNPAATIGLAPMAVPSCGSIAFELRRAGLRVTNPATVVVVNHLCPHLANAHLRRHQSEKRNYVHGRDTIPPPYALVPPVTSLN